MATLQTKLDIPAQKQSKKQKKPEVHSDSKPLSPDEKIKLFKDLFRGREDVYPVRWESKNGKFGYSFAQAGDWIDA